MSLIYDPPSGWRYGFPKPYAPLPGETLEQTLLRDGYPQAEIDQGGARHVRFIGPTEEFREAQKHFDGPGPGSGKGPKEG